MLQLRLVTDGAQPLFEVLVIDKGPGMADVEACMRDGFSTKGTAGTGLGAMRRLAAEFDVYSKHGSGTVVVSRMAQQPKPEQSALMSGVVKAPARGETVCGDAVTVIDGERGPVIVMADGLGHGPAAAESL